jgi:endoglucanase
MEGTVMGRSCKLCVWLFFWLLASQALAQEPAGGVITDLVFFADQVNERVRIYPWTATFNGIDNTTRRSGAASYRFDFGNWAGSHVLWHGIPNDNSYLGPDTSVFWIQPTSRLQVWMMSSVVDSSEIFINLYDNYLSLLGRIHTQTIPQANQWFLIDVPLPTSVRGYPVKQLSLMSGLAAKSLWIDDFKITNVRLYAGVPRSVAQMEFIGATQLGFIPNGRKQFSSPVQFTSFEVKRVSDNATVFTGGAPIRTVNDQQGVLNGATVWIGDFSNVTTPGRYKIVVGTQQSYPFDIRQDIYDQALRAAQRFFYYQRAFTAIEQQYAEGPWVRQTDASKAPPGVVKGWHDAGDLTVYNATMTQTIFWLLEAWSDFRPTDDNTNIPESGNNVPDLLDEARWGLEWLLSMQETAGGVWCNATAANGTNSYQYGRTFPHTVDPYIKTVPPTVQATAKAVAVLGYAAGVYRQFDLAFANRCLDAARRGWTWMTTNPTATNDGCSCPGPMYNVYAQGVDATLLKTNRMWAAAGLLYATGEAQYETAFQANFEQIGWISSYSKSEGFASSLYLKVPAGANQATKNAIRQRIFQMADDVRTNAEAHPFNVATFYYWGCNSNALHRTGQFSLSAYLADSTRTADRDQALTNLEYIFGRNYRNQCYVSGIDGVSKPRLRGFHHWMKALNATPWHFPGALAGGPNQSPDGNDISYPNAQPFPVWGYFGDPMNPRTGSVPVDGRFTDNDSWSTNEITINWNAALVYNLYAARAIARGRFGTSAGSKSELPQQFLLKQNYPNPFNPHTTIEFTVPFGSDVRITLYDIVGREIRTIVNGRFAQGTHTAEWDGTDSAGNQLSSGIYLYQLKAGSVVLTNKMQLLR